MVLAVQIDDTLMMIQPNKKKPQMIVTSLILFSRFFITIVFAFKMLFHEATDCTSSCCFCLLSYTFTKVSSRECCITFRNHP